MSFPSFRFLPRLHRFALLTLLLFVATVVHAEDVTVRGRLNRSISVIGDPVIFELKIDGGRRVGEPPEISADGLDIQYVGANNQAQMRVENGNIILDHKRTYSYQIVPQKNGSFTIPAVAIEVDGKSYSTQPVALTVQPSSATNGEDTEKQAFAEIVVPKKTLFLGESMPAEFRLYVDARIRWSLETAPEIGGEGWAKQKMPDPRNDQVERNGREYDLVTFKTLVTASRAGKLTLGPGEIQFQARIPRADRGRGAFDPFGNIFNDPMFAAQQQMKVKAPEMEITVKPLPQQGKPADFSGAVGNFQFTAEGTPKQVKIGDPITMKLRVAGKGSFDRVTAPVLSDTAGWRTYPPSNTFQADDPLNFTGAKTFEMAVIPEAKKTAMPEFHFSYFDPGAEKYVTLKSEPAPLTVEGDVLPPPKPVAPTADNAPPEPKKPAAEPRPDDILGLRYEQEAPQSFAPWYERREFWYAQGGVGVIFLGLIALKLRRPPDLALKQRVALQHEKDAVWRRLRSSDLGYVDFFDAAARFAQLETALKTGRPVAGIDAPAVCSAAELDEQSAGTIEAIFGARAEVYYAGGGGGGGQVSAAERERVIGALKQLEKGHAKS